jgi:hypothetical protein
LVIKGWGSWSPVTNWQRLIADNNIILIAIVKGIFKYKKYIKKPSLKLMWHNTGRLPRYTTQLFWTIIYFYVDTTNRCVCVFGLEWSNTGGVAFVQAVLGNIIF